MEVYLLFGWIKDSPAPALTYLAAGTALGVVFLRRAKAGFREILPRLRGEAERREVRQLLQLGRLWFIGALLLFPGYLTDIAALGIWLLVRGGGGPPPPEEREVTAHARLLDEDD